MTCKHTEKVLHCEADAGVIITEGWLLQLLVCEWSV
jgi:hypothetical protein